MRRFLIVLGCSAAAAVCSGCAVGSATAGYSATAGSADELKSAASERIIAAAVARANAYTDAKIAESRGGR